MFGLRTQLVVQTLRHSSLDLAVRGSSACDLLPTSFGSRSPLSRRSSGPVGGSRSSPPPQPRNDAAIAAITRPEHETTKEELASFFAQHDVRVLGGSLTRLSQQFDHAPLSDALVRVLREQYEQPTPIQSICWPAVMSGQDLVGLAHTGTGKTLAFLMPAFMHILKQRLADAAAKTNRASPTIRPKVLVMAPTRELAVQIHAECKRFQHSAGINSAVVYGGEKVSAQLRPLLTLQRERNIDLLVGTPGRLLDLVQNQPFWFDLSDASFVVLDEADRMLDMGFEPQVRAILSMMPGAKINDQPDGSNAGKHVQTVMWSATWPADVRNLAADFLRDHLTVRIGSDELQAPPTIRQRFEFCLPRERTARLIELLREWQSAGPAKVLVFCEKKMSVDYCQQVLQAEGIQAYALHGDKSQAQRQHTLNVFRRERTSVLIATDVAARGIDVSDVSHVINYEMPLNSESYVHRIGRTGRAGSHGIAHSFFDTSSAAIAGDLVEVLTTSGQEVPDALLALKKLNSPPPPRQYGQRGQRSSSPLSFLRSGRDQRSDRDGRYQQERRYDDRDGRYQQDRRSSSSSSSFGSRSSYGGEQQERRPYDLHRSYGRGEGGSRLVDSDQSRRPRRQQRDYDDSRSPADWMSDLSYDRR